MQKWLDEHPDQNRTVVEQLMSDAGHSLVFTPPFCPEVQPIELLWAQVKRYVAERSTHNRSMTEAREQTEQGFEQVTKLFCNSIVKHCHDWIDSFLATEAAGDLLHTVSRPKLLGQYQPVPVLLVQYNERRVAVHVDAMAGTRSTTPPQALRPRPFPKDSAVSPSKGTAPR